MKPRPIILLLFLIPASVFAQIPEDDPGVKAFGRLSVERERKLSGQWDLFGNVELRAGDALFNQIRVDNTIGVEYDPYKWLHTSASYSFIGKCDFKRDLSYRHRLSLSATATRKAGGWTLSAGEKLQMTHRPGEMNTWQNPRNALTCKTKIKAEYSADKHFRPYLALEAKALINAPHITGYEYNRTLHQYTDLNGNVSGEPGWMVDGISPYFCRFRAEPGIKLRIDKRHSVTMYGLIDYCYDRDVDISADGTRLKSLVNIPEFDFTFGLRYHHKF